jgi:hypothetical protein
MNSLQVHIKNNNLSCCLSLTHSKNIQIRNSFNFTKISSSSVAPAAQIAVEQDAVASVEPIAAGTEMNIDQPPPANINTEPIPIKATTTYPTTGTTININLAEESIVQIEYEPLLTSTPDELYSSLLPQSDIDYANIQVVVTLEEADYRNVCVTNGK